MHSQSLQSCPALCDPIDCSPPESMGFSRQEEGCHSLLQGIFPNQGLNPCLLHWQADSLTVKPPGKPLFFPSPATNSTRISIDRKTQTEWCICTRQCYPALNQNRIMPVTTAWVERVITILSKGRPGEKDKYQKVSLTAIFLKLMQM